MNKRSNKAAASWKRSFGNHIPMKKNFGGTRIKHWNICLFRHRQRIIGGREGVIEDVKKSFLISNKRRLTRF